MFKSRLGLGLTGLLLAGVAWGQDKPPVSTLPMGVCELCKDEKSPLKPVAPIKEVPEPEIVAMPFVPPETPPDHTYTRNQYVNPVNRALGISPALPDRRGSLPHVSPDFRGEGPPVAGNALKVPAWVMDQPRRPNIREAQQEWEAQRHRRRMQLQEQNPTP